MRRMSELKMQIAELEEFMVREFPQAARTEVKIERLHPGAIRMRLPFHDDHLRPGGTISGPTLMGLADRATYLLILAMIGPVALAVTTSLNINFLKKPAARDLIADVRLLKLGKRLAIAEVNLHSDGDDALVAHATVTYSIPPLRQVDVR
jgi:uncharacterized protein (TIGR00369 family)